MGGSTPSKPQLKLDASAKVGAPVFQSKWGSLPGKVEQMQLKDVKSAQGMCCSRWLSSLLEDISEDLSA